MEAERVAVRIGQKLLSISPISSDCCIFKVPNYLRKVNEKAYEPEVVAIGPYHRGKDHLKLMEERKLWSLQLLLQEKMENDITKYVIRMRELEERARNCYLDPVSLDSDDFVEMMLLDGCLIIQLIRNFRKTKWTEDPVLKISGFPTTLCRDMCLVENQLPLFVLWELLCEIEFPCEDKFKDDIIELFTVILPGQAHIKASPRSITEIKHLLGLMYDSWLVSALETKVDLNKNETIENSVMDCACLQGLRYDCWHSSTFEMEDSLNETETIESSIMHCATELKEAGIRFKKAEGKGIFDIKFEDGTLKIPTLAIDDDTEWFLRNVIAYEQFFSERSSKHVIEYMNFMDFLINSSQDVKILRRKGIIENWLGDDEVIATMFNRLGDSVTIPMSSLYSKVFCGVNNYCHRRQNKWIANLMQNYLNSPWALASSLAAVALLLLTMVQTVFSVLSYVK